MAASNLPLQDYGCLVTGAGRGLGRALVLDLLALGARVVALSRQQEELDRLHSHWRNLPTKPGRLLLQLGSTVDPATTVAAIHQLHDIGVGLDLLLANAAVFGPREPFHQSSDQDWEEAVLANVLGLSRCCRAAIPALSLSSRGQILVLGSAMGHQQSSHASAYAASKAMAWSLVKCLSLELAPLGIAVNEIIPGPLATSLNTAAASLPHCRQPDDPAVLGLFRYLCQLQPPLPSGQSFSLRPGP